MIADRQSIVSGKTSISGGGGGGPSTPQLDVAEILNKNNATLFASPTNAKIPVDTVNPLLGTIVDWDGASSTVTITKTGLYLILFGAYVDANISGATGSASVSAFVLNSLWSSPITQVTVDKSNGQSHTTTLLAYFSSLINAEIGVNLIISGSFPTAAWGYDMFITRISE